MGVDAPLRAVLARPESMRRRPLTLRAAWCRMAAVLSCRDGRDRGFLSVAAPGGTAMPERGREMNNRSLRALLTMAALLATVAATQAQQAADPRIADIVKAGKVRIGLHLPQFI